MGLRFIFMLTANDKTVKDAEIHLGTALAAGIHHIGFKDIGLSFERLKNLNSAIKSGGATSYLEVVSLDKKSEIISAKAAIELGVDVLMGGTNINEVLKLLKGTNIKYFPFPGKIVGYPSSLLGTVNEIVKSAKTLSLMKGVHGLDLLAYRSTCDVKTLINAVCECTEKPVIIAGSIDNRHRISNVKNSGAASFTIGSAALNGKYFSTGKNLDLQLKAIMKDVAEVNNHISKLYPKNLNHSFGEFEDIWSPRIAGQINDMQIKLVKVKGNFIWHYHKTEDELFFVHKGKLMMKFRDRDEIIKEGEFIIVPYGVEHCPVAITDVCEIVLLEPKTTINIGSIKNVRKV